MNPKEIIEAYSDAVTNSQLSRALFRPPQQARNIDPVNDRLSTATNHFDDWTDTLSDGELKEQAGLMRMIGSMLAAEEQPATPLKGKFAQARDKLIRLLDQQT